MLHINWAYSVSGLLVGALVGMTGVGGGALMTPLLVLLFGVNPSTAVGTDLLFACLTKTTGVAVHGFHGTVDWKIVRRLAAGSVPSTAATLLVLAYLGRSGHGQHHAVSTVLGVASS
jgi:Sulfite exporter TauE/SafE.